MDKDKVLLTKSGVEKLEEERDNLINVERPRVIEELQLARSQGDLSENADYDAVARATDMYGDNVSIKSIEEAMAQY